MSKARKTKDPLKRRPGATDSDNICVYRDWSKRGIQKSQQSGHCYLTLLLVSSFDFSSKPPFSK